VPKENESIINVAAGLVLAALGAVVAYYFGASKDKSDAEKADRLAETRQQQISEQ
jgi:type II secretory pathway pseudopilin PulG